MSAERNSAFPEVQNVIANTCEQTKPHQAVTCAGWRSLNGEEPPPDSEAPPGSEWTERSVQTRMERSGRNLKEDDSLMGPIRTEQKKQKKTEYHFRRCGLLSHSSVCWHREQSGMCKAGDDDAV